MAISYTTNIMALYDLVADEAAYQSPGTYGLPESAITGAVGSITIGGTNNAYTALPTFSVAGGESGSGFSGTVLMKVATAAVNAAGTGYAGGDTITFTLGTPYASTTKAIFTVTTTKLVSATIAAGGTGYGNAQTFAATVVGGTSTTAAQVSVTSSAGGVITTVNSVSVAGSYTVNPGLTGAATTGGSGTGLTLNLVFGVLTITLASAGQYTAIATSATQAATSGSGTGFTANTITFSVDSVVILDGGDYVGELTGEFSAGNATAVVAYDASGLAESRILTLIEVVRAYFASVATAEEANFSRDVLMRMMSRINTGGTFVAATVATRAQKAGVVRFGKRARNF
jgi:hypothetical protein